MKKLLFQLNFFLYLCLLPFTGYAQDVAATATPAATPPSFSDAKNVLIPEQAQGLLNELGGLFAARAATLVIYPSYDPYINVGGVKKPFGWGMALLYPVSDYAFAGLRLDFLGNSFWAPSAVVGAKYTLKNIPTSPTVFTVGGLIMPLSGAGEQDRAVGAITGIGVTNVLYHKGSFSVNAFIEGEKWTNFEGAVLHFGVAGGVRF